MWGSSLQLHMTPEPSTSNSSWPPAPQPGARGRCQGTGLPLWAPPLCPGPGSSRQVLPGTSPFSSPTEPPRPQAGQNTAVTAGCWHLRAASGCHPSTQACPCVPHTQHTCLSHSQHVRPGTPTMGTEHPTMRTSSTQGSAPPAHEDVRRSPPISLSLYRFLSLSLIQLSFTLTVFPLFCVCVSLPSLSLPLSVCVSVSVFSLSCISLCLSAPHLYPQPSEGTHRPLSPQPTRWTPKMKQSFLCVPKNQPMSFSRGKIH